MVLCSYHHHLICQIQPQLQLESQSIRIPSQIYISGFLNFKNKYFNLFLYCHSDFSATHHFYLLDTYPTYFHSIEGQAKCQRVTQDQKQESVCKCRRCKKEMCPGNSDIFNCPLVLPTAMYCAMQTV